MLETAEIKFLIDCGASSLPGLKRLGIGTDDIDAIVISHFHGDHYGGIPFILIDAATQNRIKPLRIYTPKGGQEKIEALTDLLYPSANPLDKVDVKFIEYQPEVEITTTGFSLTAFPVVHTNEALPHGLRFRLADKILSFSGDTSWTDQLIPLSENADLFICECNSYEKILKGHLSYFEIESAMPKLSCKRILLNHLGEEMLDKLADIKLECAYDGMEINLI